MAKTKIQVLAERAIHGDQEALKYLQLEETTMVGSEKKAITWKTICTDYHYCALVFIVAVKLGLDNLCRTSRMALKHINWIARQHYQREVPLITTTCTIEDLTSMMSIVLKDVPCPHLNRSEDFDSHTSSEAEEEEEEEEEPSPKKPQKHFKKSKKKRN